MNRNFWIALALAVGLVSAVCAAGGKILYRNDFEKAKPGTVPAGFMVLNGKFAVRQDGENRLLEAAGTPIDEYGVLLGPTQTAGIAVQARIRAQSRGRLLPRFGVGLNGATGYKLRVVPAKDALEIYKDEELKASVPYQWKSGAWTILQFEIRKTGARVWTLDGKAWQEDTAEPSNWLVTWNETEPPAAGRPSIWGTPYSELPIQFDDLLITAAP